MDKLDSHDDPFKESRIAYAIEKDYQSIIKSKELEDFQIGLQYKSEKTKQKDLAVFDLLLSRVKAYKKGWVQSNALQTVKLVEANEYIQWESEQLRICSQEFNELLNKIIVKIKNDIPKDKLDQLREFEIDLRKLKSKI